MKNHKSGHENDWTRKTRFFGFFGVFLCRYHNILWFTSGSSTISWDLTGTYELLILYLSDRLTSGRWVFMPGFSGSPHPGLSFSFTHLFDEVRKIDSFKNTKPQRISHEKLRSTENQTRNLWLWRLHNRGSYMLHKNGCSFSKQRVESHKFNIQTHPFLCCQETSVSICGFKLHFHPVKIGDQHHAITKIFFQALRSLLVPNQTDR